MAAMFTKLKLFGGGRKNETNSIYSMVSCSDLTPGSLEVWVDLPDEIKYDPALAPFKQLYEQHHGKKFYFILPNFTTNITFVKSLMKHW